MSPVYTSQKYSKNKRIWHSSSQLCCSKNIRLPHCLEVQIHGLLPYLNTCPQIGLFIFSKLCGRTTIQRPKKIFLLIVKPPLSTLSASCAHRPPCQSQRIKLVECLHTQVPIFWANISNLELNLFFTKLCFTREIKITWWKVSMGFIVQVTGTKDLITTWHREDWQWQSK